jgi:osmotically-inducible protein OsmY
MIRAMTPAMPRFAGFFRQLPRRLAAGGTAGLFSSLFLGLPLLLAGCSPVGTAVGVAATTINLATQERGLVTGVDDNLTWVTINERLLRHDQYLFQKVSLQVHEGRVLLTGFVQKPEDKQLATEIAWQPSGVREVKNEIKIGRSLDFGDYSEDAWLIQRLRLKLMADRQVRANNFSIDCIRSTVYLTGVAQNDIERQRVIDHARDIAYVREIVSYVRLADDALPPVPAEKPYADPPPGPAKKKPAIESAGEPVVAANVDRLPAVPVTVQPVQTQPVEASVAPATSLLPKSTQPATQKSLPATLP